MRNYANYYQVRYAIEDKVSGSLIRLLEDNVLENAPLQGS